MLADPVAVALVAGFTGVYAVIWAWDLARRFL